MPDCSVCLEKVVGNKVRMGDDVVCMDCTKEQIVPLFAAALRHEANYPVRWANTILNPEGITELLDPGFLHRWNAKVAEYTTLRKERLYCSGCSLYCGKKSQDGLELSILCSNCKASTCVLCGSEVVGKVEEHACVDTDPTEGPGAFKGLVRGKDYQLCPEKKCQTPVGLLDGCNAVRCPSSACKEEFCIVCGEVAAHDSDHWKANCPRWNRPEDTNARFDPPAQRVAHAPQPRPWVQDFQRVHRAIQAGLPQLPIRPDMTLEQQVEVERDHQRLLELSPLGVLMLDQQRQVRQMLEPAQAAVFEAGAEDFPVPAVEAAAIPVFESLIITLRLYIYRVELRAQIDGYRRRITELSEWAVGQQWAPTIERFPLLSGIFLPHMIQVQMFEIQALLANRREVVEGRAQGRG